MQKKMKYISAVALATVFCLVSLGAEARSSVHMNHTTDQTVPPAQGAMHTQETMPQASTGDVGVWDKTKEVSSDVWQGTKEVGSDVWQGTKDVSSDIWDGAKKVGSDVSDAVSGNDGAPTSNPPAAHPQ
jgi:hypothetical protein